MCNSAQTASVRGDYLIRLAVKWYRIDTNMARIARRVARAAIQRGGSRLSSAKSSPTRSRRRASKALAPSTTTSHGRGRVL